MIQDAERGKGFIAARQLKGDARSGLMFEGPDCGLCVNPKWVVRRKGFK
jgi:hypothetical protein